MCTSSDVKKASCIRTRRDEPTSKVFNRQDFPLYQRHHGQETGSYEGHHDDSRALTALCLRVVRSQRQNTTGLMLRLGSRADLILDS
jgi:hypothetical protein